MEPAPCNPMSRIRRDYWLDDEFNRRLTAVVVVFGVLVLAFITLTFWLAAHRKPVDSPPAQEQPSV